MLPKWVTQLQMIDALSDVFKTQPDPKVICLWLIHVPVPAVLFGASLLDHVLSFLTQDRWHLQAHQALQARETP